jgi:hypothetical protein
MDLIGDVFAYVESTQTLTWSTSEPLPAGYYNLELDGSQLQDTSGRQLYGGSSGFGFALPTYAAEQLVMANDEPIEVDVFSVPSLADWNADGVPDLIVGEKTDAGSGKVRIYRNTGTEHAPLFTDFVYAQKADGDLEVTGSGCLGVFPRVYDWNGDSYLDLVLGRADGKVEIFPAVTVNAANEPEFGQSFLARVGPLDGKVDINVGARATVDVVDWNNDGRYDLVTGSFDGKVRVYLNEAAAGSADFREEIVVQDGANDLVVPAMRASVAVADLDGDGRKDLVFGDTGGSVGIFANVGSDAEPRFDGIAKIEADGQPIDLPGLPRSRPFVGDYNADGRPDLLVGSEDGYVRLFEALTWYSPNMPSDDITQPGEAYVHNFSVVIPYWQNAENRMDIAADGNVIPLDVLIVINELNNPRFHNETGKLMLPLPVDAPPPYVDVNGDGYCTPLDVLEVINYLNNEVVGGEGEASGFYGVLPVTNFASSNSPGTAASQSPSDHVAAPRGLEPSLVQIAAPLVATQPASHSAATLADDPLAWPLESVLDDLAADVRAASQPL